MEIAGDAAALARGNPEVGASRVEDDLEVLGRGADGDLREVLGGGRVSVNAVSEAAAA